MTDESEPLKGPLIMPELPRKKQSLCKLCVTKMARRIYKHFGLAVPMNALGCDEEDTCDWERTADVIINSLKKQVVQKVRMVDYD